MHVVINILLFTRDAVGRDRMCVVLFVCCFVSSSELSVVCVPYSAAAHFINFYIILLS